MRSGEAAASHGGKVHGSHGEPSCGELKKMARARLCIAGHAASTTNEGDGTRAQRRALALLSKAGLAAAARPGPRQRPRRRCARGAFEIAGVLDRHGRRRRRRVDA
ncbi:MAG TPA: hypothetical protein VFQ20_08120, partial [Burkholderiaceae bacterium]|nr:hypothetical protein [Burkholderiaceae bacterium]